MDWPGSKWLEKSDEDASGKYRRLIVTLLLAGIVCRLVQYLWRMSYWHDEAFLILNIRQLSFAELFGRLPRVQAAPPVFLAVQKGMGVVFGDSEYAYRFVPLLLGIVGVILMAILARRMLSTFGAVCAMGLFAFSDRLVWHASEAKQYSGDVTVALLLLLIATWPRISLAQRALTVAVVSALLVGWSHPVVFLCGGIQLVFAWQAWTGRSAESAPDGAANLSPSPGTPGEGRGERSLDEVAWQALTPSLSQGAGRGGRADWHAMGAIIVGSILFLISFAALYWLTLRHQEQGSLYSYWADDLADWSRPWSVPKWIFDELVSLPNYVFEIVTPTMTLAVLAGAWTWWTQERRAALALLTAPILFTLIASLLGRYPFGGSRLTLFLTPGLMILAGAGFDGLARAMTLPTWRQIAVALPAVLIGMGGIEAAMYLVLPRHRSYSRPVSAYVLEHRTANEPVHVLGAVESFLPYWDGSPAPVAGFDEDAPPPRSAWFVFNFDEASDWREAMAEVELGRGYRLTDEFIVRGGAALRYERTEDVSTSPTSRATPW